MRALFACLALLVGASVAVGQTRTVYDSTAEHQKSDFTITVPGSGKSQTTGPYPQGWAAFCWDGKTTGRVQCALLPGTQERVFSLANMSNGNACQINIQGTADQPFVLKKGVWHDVSLEYRTAGSGELRVNIHFKKREGVPSKAEFVTHNGPEPKVEVVDHANLKAGYKLPQSQEWRPLTLSMVSEAADETMLINITNEAQGEANAVYFRNISVIAEK